MILERFQVPGLAQYSFVVGDSGSIAVIDPKRDVDTYIEYAKSRGLQIVYVLETRIHPVSASVAKALASQSGATLCLNRYANSEADLTGVTHRALFEGDELLLGKLVLKVARNSRRLPDQINLSLIDPFKNETPIASFSEGSLLVGSMVKPDLPGRANERLAKALCQGIQRIQELQCAWSV
jgi:hydroxyacylglutathione hydrolase